MFEVTKVPGGFAVVNWNGEVEVAYKNKKFAEQYAFGATIELFVGAEEYDLRREAVLDYIATRANRSPVVQPQLELF